MFTNDMMQRSQTDVNRIQREVREAERQEFLNSRRQPIAQQQQQLMDRLSVPKRLTATHDSIKMQQSRWHETDVPKCRKYFEPSTQDPIVKKRLRMLQDVPNQFRRREEQRQFQQASEDLESWQLESMARSAPVSSQILKAEKDRFRTLQEALELSVQPEVTDHDIMNAQHQALVLMDSFRPSVESSRRQMTQSGFQDKDIAKHERQLRREMASELEEMLIGDTVERKTAQSNLQAYRDVEFLERVVHGFAAAEREMLLDFRDSVTTAETLQKENDLLRDKLRVLSLELEDVRLDQEYRDEQLALLRVKIAQQQSKISFTTRPRDIAEVPDPSGLQDDEILIANERVMAMEQLDFILQQQASYVQIPTKLIAFLESLEAYLKNERQNHRMHSKQEMQTFDRYSSLIRQALECLEIEKTLLIARDKERLTQIAARDYKEMEVEEND